MPGLPLDQNELLRFIPAEQRHAVCGEIQPVEYQEGDVVFIAGTEGDACYLIERGAVRISVPAGDAEEETMAILGPGSFFGEMALYDGAPRSATARALEPTRLGKIERATFQKMREAMPFELEMALSYANMERIRTANRTLMQQLTDGGRLRHIGAELGTIAHNLRSPIATMVSSADLVRSYLAQDPPPIEKIAKFVDIIQRTGIRALENTDDLLRQLRGESEAEWSVVAASELVSSAHHQVSGLIDEKLVKLTVTSSTEASVLAQKAELEAALVNLLRNALEALPSGRGSVSLTAARSEDGVVFSVSDTGSGIAPEHRHRIFESRYTHGKVGGTGLGLAHVKRVVERHRGTVRITESAPGIGTTFTITIPQHGR